MRRVVRDSLRHSLGKLRLKTTTNNVSAEKNETRYSVRSARMSESSVKSNIFSVSEYSVANSRVLVRDENRDYSKQ